MIKVIREGPEKAYRMECKGCGSLLEYTCADLEEWRTDMGGYGETSYEAFIGITCPICSERTYNKESRALKPLKNLTINRTKTTS